MLPVCWMSSDCRARREKQKAEGRRQKAEGRKKVWYSLPTAYCLLPTAYCLLPTADCRLPTHILEPRSPRAPPPLVAALWQPCHIEAVFRVEALTDGEGVCSGRRVVSTTGEHKN